MQAANPAVLVRAQLHIGDETPAVTSIVSSATTPLAHAEPVHTHEPPRAVPRAYAFTTTICLALAPDQMLDDVAFAPHEKNVQEPAAQAAKTAAAEQAKASQKTKEQVAEVAADRLQPPPAKAEAAMQV
jgi:hypothetical protein